MWNPLQYSYTLHIHFPRWIIHIWYCLVMANCHSINLCQSREWCRNTIVLWGLIRVIRDVYRQVLYNCILQWFGRKIDTLNQDFFVKHICLSVCSLQATFSNRFRTSCFALTLFCPQIMFCPQIINVHILLLCTPVKITNLAFRVHTIFKCL